MVELFGEEFFHNSWRLFRWHQRVIENRFVKDFVDVFIRKPESLNAIWEGKKLSGSIQ